MRKTLSGRAGRQAWMDKLPDGLINGCWIQMAALILKRQLKNESIMSKQMDKMHE